MAYDDEEYVRYANDLDEAVIGLHENDISEDDIIQLVRDAVRNAQ